MVSKNRQRAVARFCKARDYLRSVAKDYVYADAKSHLNPEQLYVQKRRLERAAVAFVKLRTAAGVIGYGGQFKFKREK